jgi:hypothetical protein
MASTRSQFYTYEDGRSLSCTVILSVTINGIQPMQIWLYFLSWFKEIP